MIANGSNHIKKLSVFYDLQLANNYTAIKTHVHIPNTTKISFPGLIYLYPLIHISHIDLKLTLD